MSLANLKRCYQIHRTLLTYGLDELIPFERLPWFVRLARMLMFWLSNQHADKSLGERSRLAMEDLGPVFIKFGQMLSTRKDLLSDDIAKPLSLLQDRVTPFPGQQAKAKIEASLGFTLEEAFCDFDLQPLASASIAQVHTAKLLDSEKEVVFKVVRPDIIEQIERDIALMSWFAHFTQRFVKGAKQLRPIEVVAEYRKTLMDELDMQREAANALQLRRNFKDSPALYIPEVYSDYCRNDLMVMERIYGIPVSDVEALNAQNTNMKILAERGVEVFFTQVFRDSFFHADMHPGNVFVSKEHPEDPQYIGIDCGIVGTLNREDKRYLAENFLAFFNRNYLKVAQLHIDSGWVPADTNVEEFEAAMRTVLEPVFEKPLEQISFGHILLNMFNVARRFNMQVQPQLVLLQKTLLYVEGLGRQLYPQLDLWQTAKPFLENWMQEQVGLKGVWKSVQENMPLWAERGPEIPNLLYDNLVLAKQKQQALHQLAENYLESRKQSHQAFFQLGLGSSLALIAVLAFKYSPAILTYSLGAMALLLWVLAWKKLR